MKIKIKRVRDDELDCYKENLDKYNAVYSEEKGRFSNKYHALIEINTVEELFSLAKELGKELIISTEPGTVLEIYDGFIE